MEEVKEHIRLLSIGHYIVAGLTGLFSLFPLIHVGLGLSFLFGDFPQASPKDEFPSELFGGIFVIVGAMAILMGLSCAILIGIAGKKMKEFRSRTYCLVIAGVLCAIFPLGTVLGVLSLITLLKPEAKTLFSS